VGELKGEVIPELAGLLLRDKYVNSEDNVGVPGLFIGEYLA
jgi:hypothetical protein